MPQGPEVWLLVLAATPRAQQPPTSTSQLCFPERKPSEPRTPELSSLSGFAGSGRLLSRLVERVACSEIVNSESTVFGSRVRGASDRNGKKKSLSRCLLKWQWRSHYSLSVAPTCYRTLKCPNMAMHSQHNIAYCSGHHSPSLPRLWTAGSRGVWPRWSGLLMESPVLAGCTVIWKNKSIIILYPSMWACFSLLQSCKCLTVIIFTIWLTSKQFYILFMAVIYCYSHVFTGDGL